MLPSIGFEPRIKINFFKKENMKYVELGIPIHQKVKTLNFFRETSKNKQIHQKI